MSLLEDEQCIQGQGWTHRNPSDSKHQICRTMKAFAQPSVTTEQGQTVCSSQSARTVKLPGECGALISPRVAKAVLGCQTYVNTDLNYLSGCFQAKHCFLWSTLGTTTSSRPCRGSKICLQKEPQTLSSCHYPWQRSSGTKEYDFNYKFKPADQFRHPFYHKKGEKKTDAEKRKASGPRHRSRMIFDIIEIVWQNRPAENKLEKWPFVL